MVLNDHGGKVLWLSTSTSTRHRRRGAAGGSVPPGSGEVAPMKIPYGISNFGDLRTEGYYYVDKTL